MFSAKKILFLILALTFLSTGISEASESCSSSSNSSSSSTTPPAALPIGSPISFTFMVLPSLIKLTSGHTDIRFAASLAPAYNFRNAQIIARIIKGKTHFAYSRSLRQFMRSLALTKADFKPLETYLKGQLKMGRRNLLPYVTILATYLQTGQAPVFTLNFQQ